MNLLQVNLKETFYDAKHEITIILSVLDRMVKIMVRFINKQKSKINHKNDKIHNSHKKDQTDQYHRDDGLWTLNSD